MCIALSTRKHVPKGFTYAHRTAPQPTYTLEEDKEKLPETLQCKRKNGRNLGRSNSVRDPLLQRRLVKERSRTQAKHSNTTGKCQLGFETSIVQLGRCRKRPGNSLLPVTETSSRLATRSSVGRPMTRQVLTAQTPHTLVSPCQS